MLRFDSSSFVSFRLTRVILGILFLLSAVIVLPEGATAQSSVRPPSNASSSAVPAKPDGPSNDTGNLSNALGSNSNSDFWRALREGTEGRTSVTGPFSGQAIRAPAQRLNGEAAIREAASGDHALSQAINPNRSSGAWRAIRNGPLPRYGSYVLGGMLALLALFFLLRGRIRVEHGMSGFTVTRFTTIERAGHWLLASSFVILAFTGLSITFGKTFLSPVLGKELFATIAVTGKLLHNYVGFAFMVGLALVFIMWVKDNFPNRHDVIWALKGGGMFSKSSHPPAKKFNLGQKILFWLVILGGVSVSLSGISLLFPGETTFFKTSFVWLNTFGLGLPTDLSLVQEQQFASIWHAVMAIVLTAIIFAHIYIGTLGMEGAFDAMGSGEVDVNWAREHHSVWYQEVASGQLDGRGESSGGSAPAPAE